MGIILLWLAQLPCAAAIILVSPSPPDPWIPKPRGGPFCMRAGFVYATIEFTASLNLCLSFRFRFHCLLLLLLLPLLVLFAEISPWSVECWANECQKLWLIGPPFGPLLLLLFHWLKQLAMSEQLSEQRHLHDDPAHHVLASCSSAGCVLL